MTALGTVIGVAVLVGVLALTTAASLQVSKAFDLQEATLVRVTQTPPNPTTVGSLVFGLESPESVLRVEGVVSASLSWRYLDRQVSSGGKPNVATVIAATPGISDVSEAKFTQGRSHDMGHEARRARVAVLGSGLANDLGISSLQSQPAVLIGGVPFNVIGIVGSTKRLPELLTAVVVPAATAQQLWGEPPADADPALSVAVRPGAATVVSEQLPLALSARYPGHFKAQTPPDPKGLRQSVDRQLQVLFIVLAGVCLGIGVIGIANTASIAVVERTGEIGLRRAMGASRSEIAGQFVAETGILGGAGGMHRNRGGDLIRGRGFSGSWLDRGCALAPRPGWPGNRRPERRGGGEFARAESELP